MTLFDSPEHSKGGYCVRVFFLPILVLAATAAHAQERPPTVTSHLVPYVGVGGVLDSDRNAQFGVEYRWHDVLWGLRPTIGLNVDNDAAIYGYGGLSWDLPLGRSFYVTPSFMIGAYSHGDSKDLGGWLEFRSGIEVAYAFKDGSRIGIAFNHVSNADVYDDNPGLETVLIGYHFPIAY